MLKAILLIKNFLDGVPILKSNHNFYLYNTQKP